MIPLKNYIKHSIDIDNHTFIKREELLCIIKTMIIADIIDSKQSPSEDSMKTISYLILQYFVEPDEDYRSNLYNLIYEIILKCNYIDNTDDILIIKDKLNELLK